MKKYTAIHEMCGNEGENWITFLITEGNEDSISKLKTLCEKYNEELEGEDSCLKITDISLTEKEVDTIVNTYKRFDIGCYDDLFTKCDSIIKLKNIKNIEEFVYSYYKRKLFK